MILSMYMLLEERNRLVDFPYPFLKTTGSVMMPVNNQEKEKESYHPSAILKPFQWQVMYNMNYYISRSKLQIGCSMSN